MHRIGGRLGDTSFGMCGADVGIPLFCYWNSNIEAVKPADGQCQVDSLTGAVASERVTEAPKGTLRMDGNHSESVKAEGCLTARLTSRAETKVGLSDPAV